MASSFRNSHRIYALILCSLFSGSLSALDWSTAASRDVTFFYPGHATWEKILVKETHEGATKVRQKKTCLSCHEGEQADMGEAIVNESDHPFHHETEGPSSLTGMLKIALENEQIYFQVSLPTAEVSQLSILLDDNSYPHTELSGCWSSCHDDNRGMESADSMDLSKYLSVSRSKNTRTGGGESYKPDAELKDLIAKGQFLELIAAHVADGSAKGLHGYVLEARHLAESSDISTQIQQDSNGAILVIQRPFKIDSTTTKQISAEGSYTMGMALHLYDATGASHLVTMPVKFVLDQGNKVQFLPESK